MKKGTVKALSLLIATVMTACFITACGKTPQDAAKPTEAVSPTEVQNVTEPPVLPTEASSLVELTDEQEASIAMLNYLAYVVQQINSSRHSRAALEDAFDSLLNDVEPSGIDDTTRQAFQNIFETIKRYRMNDFSRERLEYRNDQNTAGTILSLVPNPSEIVNTIQEKGKLAALCIAADIADKGFDLITDSTYVSEEERNLIELEWDLTLEEEKALMDSRTDMFDYMVQIARGLPKGITLSESDIAEFVTQTTGSRGAAKLDWLKNNRERYRYFGYYWLELADCCFENNDYAGCISAIESYRGNDFGIFKHDKRLAHSLQFAIVSAKETMSGSDYETAAADYADTIITNIGSEDWELRYYTSLVYLDLYNESGNSAYLEKAYSEAKTNVRNLVPVQKEQNRLYLGDVIEVQAEAGADKETTGIINAYNKYLKNNRETELPPVCEPLLRSCELLFAIADMVNIPDAEKTVIDSILHDHDEPVFLSSEMDRRFSFENSAGIVNLSEDRIDFSGTLGSQKLTIPVVLAPEGTSITAEIVNAGETIGISEWSVQEVERKNAVGIDDFSAVFSGKSDKTILYKEGDTVTLRLVPPGAISEDDVMIIKLVVDRANVFGVHFKLMTDQV